MNGVVNGYAGAGGSTFEFEGDLVKYSHTGNINTGFSLIAKENITIKEYQQKNTNVFSDISVHATYNLNTGESVSFSYSNGRYLEYFEIYRT